jgi:FAD/FMN-containing dehydrogenase
MSNISSLPPELRAELLAVVGPTRLIEGGETLEALSKDFYWYSPVLERLLGTKVAAAAVRVSNLEELKAVVSACARAKVPVIPRGAGTGNYGQCVPIHGGVVIDLTPFDKVLEISPEGWFRAEPGARLATIETEARKIGWELRNMPSTWVKSSLGGYFCGGSGGIGSVTWGGIAAPDNVKSVTLMSCEETPRMIKLEGQDANPGLHTYGTTGIMVEIEMRLAPRFDYDQMLFSSPDWSKLLDWTDMAARNAQWSKRLVTMFQDPIPTYFKPLLKYFRPGEHVSLYVVDKNSADEVVASAAAAGIDCVCRLRFSDPPKPPYLSDYTFNHTSLWAIKSDPSYTYIQAGFGENFREQFQDLHAKFPGEIVFHLEWFSRRGRLGPGGKPGGDGVVVGGIPLVHFVSEARLQEIIDYCARIGVGVNNPHTYFLEDGGHHPDIEEKRALKANLDPLGLLNPGKMRTYPFNPFAEAAELSRTL